MVRDEQNSSASEVVHNSFSAIQSQPFVVSVLYVFAGKHRKSDLGDQLRTLEAEGKFVLKIVELDLLRSPQHDITVADFWQSILARIRLGEWRVVLMTPPCNTHSRARNANRYGPPPVRSKLYPYGFPWLTGKLKKEVELANSFVEQTIEACRAASLAQSAYFIEHPEDLGATVDNQQPASIFALEELHKLAQETGAVTAAFHQCPWNSLSQKPTRVVSTLPIKDSNVFDNKLYFEWPQLDKFGFYHGPLPRKCGHFHPPLIKRTLDDASFRTSLAAAYPPQMCLWLAYMIVAYCCKPKVGVTALATAHVGSNMNLENRDSNLSVEVQPLPILEAPSSSEEEEGIKKPLLKNHLPGNGPPMNATWSGKTRELHDGAGLCSPGRWLPQNRKPCKWTQIGTLASKLSRLLEESLGEPAKICFGLACGKFSESPFSQKLILEGRRLVAEEVAMQSKFSVEELLQVQEFQPFLLRLIGEGLRLMGDPDWRIYFESKRENFWDGVSVGPDVKMPRTPSVFEKKVKHRKYDESEFSSDMLNYKSASGPEMSKVLEQQFVEEEKLGMMFRISLAEAKQQYGNLRIAAQGAIEKSDESWRVLHDATHGVRVNNETIIRDQIRMPSAGDQKTIMKESASHDEGVHFSLQYDVKKAHRRFRHRRSEWGLLGCRSDDNSDQLWLNRVGTFGFTCASYWWGRLAAGVARFVLFFFGNHWVVQLIFADDIRFQSNGKHKFKHQLLALFLWVITGTPMSWAKCKGGLSCEWIGFWIDYQRFELGISEGRACWLIKWGHRVVKDGLVQMRDFAEGLGRLGFCAGILEFYKPFLAPLYAWSAAAPLGAVLAVPPLVRLTLSWIIGQLESGKRMTPCRKVAKDLGLLFKTDAKGEENYVVLGGWECAGGVSTAEARWFSVTLDREEIPWLFTKGHSSRTIASSELLATMLAIFLFIPLPTGDPGPTKGQTQCKGLTDNQSNTFVVAKLMTTTFPLSAVLMQMTSMLGARNLWLDLSWVARDQNTEADSLTNSDFSGFTEANRLPVIWADLPLDVLDALIREGTGFMAELDKHRENKKRAESIGIRVPRKRRRVKQPWG